MAIRSQLAWYWRWLLTVLLMVLVATVVWWLVQNSYRITGFDIEEAKAHLTKLTEENRVVRGELETARGTLSERDRQLQIEKAAQGELARTVAQLQDENATLKEDLGFLRNIMSSGTTPEGIAMSNLKVERDGEAERVPLPHAPHAGRAAQAGLQGQGPDRRAGRQGRRHDDPHDPGHAAGRPGRGLRIPFLPEGRGPLFDSRWGEPERRRRSGFGAARRTG
jgi:regulator of replication initiation timing